jgi:thiopurine S-methyltransferase
MDGGAGTVLERDKAAWLERWEEGRTGFHNDRVNPRLAEHWQGFGLPAGSRVLVPLSGKSLDLLWLAEHGYRVVANELSPLAVEAFFDGAGMRASRRHQGAFEIWSHGLITVLCGDYFDLEPAVVGRLDACYDRAALVALPPALRPVYMEHQAGLLPAGAPVLLIGVDYPQPEMEGPPFSVTEAEVRRLAAGRFEVEVLAAGLDMLADNPRFAERGVTRMEETVYRLVRSG